jgi:glycosyltransferase involved in cell wall biosynthesis
MNKKKLCHVFFDEYPKDSRIRRYTNALVDESFKVYIISLHYKGAKFFEKSENVYIYRVPLYKKRGSFIRRIYEYVLFEFLAFWYVNYIFFRHFVSLYQVHTLPDFLVLSCIIPRLLGRKVILDFHELFPEAMMQFKKVRKDSKLFKILLLQEVLSYKFANKIIAFHDPAKEILLSRINSKKTPVTIMNGVDENEMPEFERKNNNNFKIIYNGTINYNLNLRLVVKAMIYIRDSDKSVFDKISFHLYGDGPDIDNILSDANRNKLSNVHYEGRLPFQQMMSSLEKASLCVLPPVKDIYSDLFYSLKLIEMIYLKIPVVATRLNTYLKYYPENCLFYFNSNDYKDLAEKILFVYNNPEKVKVFTDNAFSEYQKYNWNIMKSRYLNLINSIYS